jgi:hypothetical protein
MGNPPDDLKRGRCREARTRSSATRQHLPDNPAAKRQPFFSWRRMRFKVPASEMESAMRMIGAKSLVARSLVARSLIVRSLFAAGLVAGCGMLALTPARADADTVPPFKGNDTGGIIAYPLTGQIDIRALAINHCASYGKVVKFLAVEPHYGGYISFSCRWLPYAAAGRPLRARY